MKISAADFAENCISTVTRTKNGMSLHDAIYKTSEKLGYQFHLGFYEYKKAEKEIVKLIRPASKPTIFDKGGKPLNGYSAGKYHAMVGVKIFPNKQSGKLPEWAGNANPREMECPKVTGDKLPIVKDFRRLRGELLGAGGVNRYNDIWLNSKIKATPASRDNDLGAAIAVFNDAIASLKDNRDLRLEIDELKVNVRFLMNQHKQAMAA